MLTRWSKYVAQLLDLFRLSRHYEGLKITRVVLFEAGLRNEFN